MKELEFKVFQHGKKIGLMLFTFGFSALIVYLLHNQFDRQLFCLMNIEDSICETHTYSPIFQFFLLLNLKFNNFYFCFEIFVTFETDRRHPYIGEIVLDPTAHGMR